MKQIFILTFLLILPFAFLSAEWKGLDDSRSGSELQVNLISSDVNETVLEVTIPGYYEKKILVDQTECVYFHIPGSSVYMKQGYPMLPKLTKLVQMPHDCNVKLEVLSKEEATLSLNHPVVPSKGHLTRDINPDSIPYEFGPVYKQNVFWPGQEEQFSIGENFQFREACGVRLQIIPVSVNHVTKSMTILKKAVISLKYEQKMMRTFQNREREKSNKTFQKMYNEMFLNPSVEADSRVSYSEERGTVPDAANKKLVVVVPSKFESLIGEWVAWKKQCGYTVTIKSVAAGVTAGEIKSYLQGLYDNAATRFGYVVLIGDAAYNSNFQAAQPMPTFAGSKEGAAADRVYVRLAGSDNYPDAFISRISGNTDAEITNQLAKIIAYEKEPPSGSWFTQGTCIASDQGSPTDKERAEWLQNGGGSSQKVPVVSGGLIGYGYTKFDDIYDPAAYASDVTNAVNQGRSIILYIGHGSSTSWGTTGFGVSHINNLTNGGMLPVIWSVACVNGDFLKTGTCFAEAWLRKAKAGAVAVEAASTNESWVPPCDKQAATVNSMIQKKYFTFGALEAVGCVRGLEVWGDTNSSEGNKMAEQCNLFGDCTLMVRSKVPQTMEVQVNRGLDNNLVFDIVSENRSQEGCTVTIYNQDFSFSVTGDSDAQGKVSLSLANCPQTPLFYTVVGPDMIPIVDQELK